MPTSASLLRLETHLSPVFRGLPYLIPDRRIHLQRLFTINSNVSVPPLHLISRTLTRNLAGTFLLRSHSFRTLPSLSWVACCFNSAAHLSAAPQRCHHVLPRHHMTPVIC